MALTCHKIGHRLGGPKFCFQVFRQKDNKTTDYEDLAAYSKAGNQVDGIG